MRKYFEVNIFELSIVEKNVKANVEKTCLIDVNNFSRIIQSCFLTEIKKGSYCQTLFLTF